MIDKNNSVVSDSLSSLNKKCFSSSTWSREQKFTVGRQLPPMPLPPTKMADAPSGRDNQSRFWRVYKLDGYF